MTQSLRSQITAAIGAAAAELELSVAVPYHLVTPAGATVEYLALVRGFGAKIGTLLCLSNEWQSLSALRGEQGGYYVSGLYPGYGRYDRQQWIDTLNDWGWHGDGAPPSWYTGVSPWG